MLFPPRVLPLQSIPNPQSPSSHPAPGAAAQGIIDLIQAKAMSIFTLLDEECRMPKAPVVVGWEPDKTRGKNWR